MLHHITVMPQQQNIQAAAGENLLAVLQGAGFFVNAACGGNGTCGKCSVWIDEKKVLACKTVIDRDMTVTLPSSEVTSILTDGMKLPVEVTASDGFSLAFDIGTTTVVGYLISGNNAQDLACVSALNPQAAYGADVISRIQQALKGHMEELTAAIRKCISDLACQLCEKAGVQPWQIHNVSLVGNPAMQQFFLGILPNNLAQLPFAPALTKAKTVAAKDFLPLFENAQLLIVPDISGFVGADTVACILATGLHKKEELSLLVDIGTNGEMVLGNKYRMVACSTAAGPALEGANILFGMRGQNGAIDHVRLVDGKFQCSVIGNGEAAGICGSGIIDAVATALEAGLINQRGRIQNEDRCLHLTDQVWLTQEDVRQVQQAKGAIAAGIELMATHLGIDLQDIQKVYLAGAFGTFMDPVSACKIGILPSVLESKISAVGNAAGSGAKMLACNDLVLSITQKLTQQVEFIELASISNFSRCFAQNMRFSTSESYWCQKAISLGFSKAVPLDVDTLQPRQDIREMCAANTCGAYGKNWTCPPYCGTLEECSDKLRQYSRGILLQTIGSTEKLIDTKAYRRIEAQHLEQFHRFCEELRQIYPYALCLGSGGCRICGKCAFPERCRFPEKACSSMEGYGLFVTEVCRSNKLSYHYGERTITYTACILY